MKKILFCLAFLGLTATGEAQVYNNPVTHRSLPDPTVMRGDDGYFYLMATEDTHNIPVMKSKDLVNWNYLRTAFTDATRPDYYCEHGWAFWAPDVNKIGNNYVLYYSHGVWGHGDECAIGVATSKRIYGPYSNSKVLFTSPEIGVNNSIDPCFFQDDDGKNYLFWGSFNDIYMIELSEDGLSIAEGAEKKKVAGGIMEAAYVFKHDKYYYLIGSAGSCCEGANSTYRLVMARSNKVTGPYVDKNGRAATGDNMSELLHRSAQVYGPGHCSEWQIDDNGDYWILYHGFQADNVDQGRVTYLDKVLWDTKGWPYIKNDIPSVESEVPYFATSSIKGVTDDNLSYKVSVAEGLYQLLIESPDNSPFTWRITAPNGSLLKQGRADKSLNVWTTDLTNGLYIVTVSGKYGTYSQKVFINQ